MSVDLPAPLEPSTATISPGSTVEIDAAQDLGRAVAGMEAADVEQRLSGMRALPQHLRGRAVAEIGLDHARVGGDLRAACPAR